MPNRNAVVLLSGGLDSTTTLAIAKEQCFKPYALIGTTMNVYGDSVAESQRKANSKVVSLLLSKKTV
jgi:7-cyano-7-deazaguanine synthase in queuosine biosynthesis